MRVVLVAGRPPISACVRGDGASVSEVCRISLCHHFVLTYALIPRKLFLLWSEMQSAAEENGSSRLLSRCTRQARDVVPHPDAIVTSSLQSNERSVGHISSQCSVRCQAMPITPRRFADRSQLCFAAPDRQRSEMPGCFYASPRSIANFVKPARR